MKKLIILGLILTSFATSFAQSSTIDKAKEVITKQPKNNPETYPDNRRVSTENYPTSGSREAEISEINRQYEAKIQAVRVNPILSAEEKERRIKALEYERAQKVRQVNNRYYGSDDYSKKQNKAKGKAYGKDNNPGKRLGWEKGKGNPHRSENYSKGKNKNK
jgi:hypothetical protein